MVRISNIILDINFDFDKLNFYICEKFGINYNNVKEIYLHKKSVDARKKDNIKFNCAVNVEFLHGEDKFLKIHKSNNICKVEKYRYELPSKVNLKNRPLVVGFGPAGMFCGLILAMCGQKPIIIERGKDVGSRTKDVSLFWESGKFNPASNVQFGEGGAGTFSDGKLTTGIKDKRVPFVLSQLVLAGAPKEIKYLSKPHIGTDNLKRVVKNIRERIIELGGEIRFEHKLAGLMKKGNAVVGVMIEHDGFTYNLETANVALCIGHSARDTIKMLYDAGVQMSAKAFSVGVRIEHPQSMINQIQYGKFCNNKNLGAADYKFAVHLENGRGVYTFCMCPGGTVVAAASEENMVVTNGMSEYARSSKNANSAILVGVTPSDFGSDSPISGIEFQRKIEKKAFELGGGNYFAPVQTVGDFLQNKVTQNLGSVIPSYLPGYRFANLAECFPDYVTESLREGILEMDKKARGVALTDAILTGVETRSSSPVRIDRKGDMESASLQGLYPCAEGAGYAGGIISAAVDGIKCAEAIMNKVSL